LLSQNSDDPNGTLITGLQNRERPLTQVDRHSTIADLAQLYAFEELAFIAWNSKERRQSIFNENSGGLSTWNRMLKASLEILAEVKAKHQHQQRIPNLTALLIAAPSSTKPSAESATSQAEGIEPVPISQANIFNQKGSRPVPFDFVRSVDGPSDNIAFFSNILTAQRLSKIDTLVGRKLLFISWPFKACAEFRASANLGHVRLVVISMQGISL
jgi:Nucleoporin protein Ndc1-Nup